MRHSSLLDFAKDLVQETGELILSTQEKRSILSNTPDKGILAEGDLSAHKIILEKIKQAFPDHVLISEENERKQDLGTDTWICDPICGTYNYTHGIPYFAIGLSYLKDGEIKFGIIYNPVSGELFQAARGEGAYLNDEKIKVSERANLSAAIVDFNCNFSSVSDREKGRKLFSLLCPPVTARLRLTESANLDLAYVACGRYDAYLHPSDKVWDQTAGKILIEEAGGQVLNFSRADEYSIFSPGVIATNGKITKELKSMIAEMLDN